MMNGEPLENLFFFKPAGDGRDMGGVPAVVRVRRIIGNDFCLDLGSFEGFDARSE